MSRQHGSVLTALVALLLPLAVTGTAEAQYAPPPPPAPAPGPAPAPAVPVVDNSPIRSGFMLGGALGVGSLSLESDAGSDSMGSLAFDAYFGGYVTSRLALIVELWGNIASTDDVCVDGRCFSVESGTLSQANAGLAAQYHLGRSFWIRAGIGTSRLTQKVDGDTVETADGIAVFGAAAWEFYQRATYAFDLQIRLTGASYDTSFMGAESGSAASFQLGFTWY